MKAVALMLAFAAAPAVAGKVGPSEVDFNAAHAANCPEHAARAKSVRCKAIQEEPTEFRCSYKLPEAGGGWDRYIAYVAIDGAKWVWLDGETRCYTSAMSSVN